MTYMSIQMIVSGFTLDTLGDNNWVCYSFEYVPDQILFPVPDTPVPQVKYYLQYQSHQSNDISSTRHTKPACQILSPVPVSPAKYYFQYQTHQTRMSNIISSTSHTSQMIFQVPVSPAKYNFRYLLTSQILFPVPDTPNPHVKYYLQYQSHQPNIISSTRHTKPECQILFPVPVTPVK